jgi:HD-GYP domain-containing protein (c-di-GMP phosphodiesterase class II)
MDRIKAFLRRLYFPLLTQITVPYMLLALVVAGGGTFIVSRLVFDSVEERFANQLIATATQAKDGMLRQEESLLANLRLLSNTQGVDAAAQAGDSATLRALLLPAALNGGVEYLAVLNSASQPLVAVRLDEAAQGYVDFDFSGDVAGQAFVQDILQSSSDTVGDKFSALTQMGGDNLLLISGPITDAQNQTVGALLVGRSADSIAAQLRTETLAQLTFYATDGRVLASTLLEPRALTSEQSQQVLVNQDTSSLTLPLSASDVDYNEFLSIWEVRGGQDLGVMGVANASTVLIEASQFTQRNTVLLISLTLLSVVVLGLWLSGRILRPIGRLKIAAEQVAKGNLKVQVPAGGRDEIGVLADSFNAMVGSVSKSKQDLLDAYEKTIEGWAKATDLRDRETEGHSRRVTELAVALAQSMGIRGDELLHLRRGALLHDIGKIGVPDAILHKKGPLTSEERKVMEQHPLFARQFMEQVEFLKPALAIPYAHHEKWDGSGYPEKLKGEQIPLPARIFAIVDVWDALTSDRPYRDALGFDDTMKHVLKESGHHFDPQVVLAFKKMMGR